MKTTVTFSDFVGAFRLANRQGTFSYDGLRALFAYLEEVERDSVSSIRVAMVGM